MTLNSDSGDSLIWSCHGRLLGISFRVTHILQFFSWVGANPSITPKGSAGTFSTGEDFTKIQGCRKASMNSQALQTGVFFCPPLVIHGHPQPPDPSPSFPSPLPNLLPTPIKMYKFAFFLDECLNYSVIYDSCLCLFAIV